jgi:hypothetical protein
MTDIFIMTWSNGQPAGYFPLQPNQINFAEPPWVFPGYTRMMAESAEEAEKEFEEEIRYWVQRRNFRDAL